MTPVSDTKVAKVRLLETFKTPGSQRSAPALYTDLTFQPETKTLLACSDGAQGEFPVLGGEIVFSPPAFVADTGEFEIRGFARVEGIGMCAAENRGKFVFLGQKRAALPRQVRDVVGLAFDGRHLLVADGASNTVHRLAVTADRELRREGHFTHWGSEPLTAITWDGERLWTADTMNINALRADGTVAVRIPLPGIEVSGLAFAEGFLFATGYREKVIYKLELATKTDAG